MTKDDEFFYKANLVANVRVAQDMTTLIAGTMTLTQKKTVNWSAEVGQLFALENLVAAEIKRTEFGNTHAQYSYTFITNWNGKNFFLVKAFPASLEKRTKVKIPKVKR